MVTFFFLHFFPVLLWYLFPVRLSVYYLDGVTATSCGPLETTGETRCSLLYPPLSMHPLKRIPTSSQKIRTPSILTPISSGTSTVMHRLLLPTTFEHFRRSCIRSHPFYDAALFPDFPSVKR